MPSNKTISVIIPAFNRADYIAASIDSVLSQKIPKGWKLEIIVVDDGSTDNIHDTLETYVEKGLVHFFPLAHSGKPATPRNFGISKASGEIIAFQDSDDLWSPDKISNQLKIFDDKKTVLVYGQAEIVDKDGASLDSLLVKADRLASGQKFESLIKENVISTLTVMVRREVFDKVGYFNETDEAIGSEDFELWLRISVAYPHGIKCTDKTLAKYRRHSEGISATNPLISLKCIWNALDLLWSYPSLSTSQRNVLEKEIEIIYSNYARQYNQMYGTPLVSVIMGVYNAERFIRPAVDSILGQTYTNFEFIIINDGSEDNTVNVLNSYNDPRIRIINQVNHGLVYSLNKAIGLATGEYIARMDADDICLPSRFEKEVEWLSRDTNRGLVSTYFSLIDYENGRPTGITMTFPIRHIDLLRAMYVTNPFPHGACMYRAQAVKSCGLYDKKYISTEDYELWTRVAQKWEVGIIPESLYWYRINNPNSISQLTTKTQESFVKKIRDEQWSKPFIRKTIRNVRKDLLEIRHEVPCGYRGMTESIYKGQQLSLSKELFLRGKPLHGSYQLIGTFFVDPRGVVSWMLHFPKKVLRHIKFKIRRDLK